MVEVRTIRHGDQTYEVHVHRDLVRLPDGTPITAVSFDPVDPYGRKHAPDFGLYLDSRWQPPWDHDQIHWPDFGVPEDPAAIRAGLLELLGKARQGKSVELGCLGGHGRTGTALAILATLTGHPADDAVAWVRAHYCPEAVETVEQQDYVESVDHGQDQPGS